MSFLHARSSRVATIVIGVTCAASAARAQSLMQTQGNTLAYEGMAVPGAPGAIFAGPGAFDSGVMDEVGRVLFRGRLFGGGTVALNERALFRGTTAGNLALVIRGSDPAPGLPGLTLNTATASGIGGSPRLSADGRTFFGSSLSGAGVVPTNDTALFGGPVASLGVIAREGDPAPGTVGATLSSSFSNPSQQPTGINRQGRVLFQSATLGGDTVATNNAGWFSGTSGSLELVQRKGDTVLGGAVISALGFISQMNDTGQILHDETLSTTLGTSPATAANNVTVWVYTPGSGNALVVREGDPAPGTVGATFNVASNAWSAGTGSNNFNRTGQALLQLDLLGGDVVAGTNDRGLYVGGTSGLTLAMRRGDPAPGTLANFDTVSNTSMNLNNSGGIAFSCSLVGGGVTTTDDSGIWAGLPGSLVLVAREGDSAPGTVGAVFGSLVGISMHANDLGQVLFQAGLVGGDVAAGNASALYAWDPTLGLAQVIRGNDMITVAPADTRTTGSWGGIQFNNGDAANLSFGHNGKIVQRVNFIDGTAAIISVNVPRTVGTPFCEPGHSRVIACPCANPNGAGLGCGNTGSFGANLASAGTASLALDATNPGSVTLTGSTMLSGAFGTFLQGNVTNGAGVTFGAGVRCTGGMLLRLKVASIVGGTSTYPVAGDLSISNRSAFLGDLIMPGETRWYQTNYRDTLLPNPGGSCPTIATFNITSGQQIVWGP